MDGRTGAALERHACNETTLQPFEIAISPDRRYIVVTGNHRSGPASAPAKSVTCIVDRTAKRVRSADAMFVEPVFDTRSKPVAGTRGAFVRGHGAWGTTVDLATGAVLRDADDTALALPNDRLLRSAAGRLSLVDRATGAAVMTFQAGSWFAASADGKHIAVARGAGIALFDATGQSRGEIADRAGTDVFALSPDGNQLVAWSGMRIDEDDGPRNGPRPPQPPPTAIAWDLAKHHELWRRPELVQLANAWVYSRDGTLLESRGHRELLVDARTGAVVRPPQPPLRGSAFDHSGTRFLQAGGHTSSIWTMGPAEIVRGGAERIVAWSRDRATTLVHRGDGRLALLGAVPCRDLGVAVEQVHRAAFAEDLRTVYVVERRAKPPTTRAYVFDVATGQPLRGVELDGWDPMIPLPALGQLAIAARDGVRRYDVASGAERATHAAQLIGEPVEVMADGRRLVGRMHGGLALRDLAEPRRSVALTRQPFEQPYAIATSRAHLALGTSDGAISVWRDDGRNVRTMRPSQAPVALLALSPDGARLAATDRLATAVRVLDVARGTVVGTVQLATEHATLLQWSADGQLAIATAQGHAIVVRAK